MLLKTLTFYRTVFYLSVVSVEIFFHLRFFPFEGLSGRQLSGKH